MRMKDEQDGGPAFPQPLDASIPNYDDHGSPVPSGMSLRDYFAGQALAAIVDFTDSENYTMGKEAAQQVSQTCYMLADAMLVERAR